MARDPAATNDGSSPLWRFLFHLPRLRSGERPWKVFVPEATREFSAVAWVIALGTLILFRPFGLLSLCTANHFMVSLCPAILLVVTSSISRSDRVAKNCPRYDGHLRCWIVRRVLALHRPDRSLPVTRGWFWTTRKLTPAKACYGPEHPSRCTFARSVRESDAQPSIRWCGLALSRHQSHTRRKASSSSSEAGLPRPANGYPSSLPSGI